MVRLTPLKARSAFKARLGFTLLTKKPLRFFCAECGKYIPSNLPWACGFCDHANVKADYYSLLNKCKNCKQVPKALRCPHCSEINFLTKEMNAEHPARSLSAPLPPPVDQTRNRSQERLEEKEELEHQIVLTRLNAELALARKQIAATDGDVSEDGLRESLARHEALLVAIQRIARERRAAIQDEFADDAEMAEKMDEAVTDWVENQLRKQG
jgi:hypothetical protein